MEPKLDELLHTFIDALDYYTLHLCDPSKSLKSLVTPANVAAPLEELVKLAKLIRAHTTKVGILFEPSSLAKSGSAAITTINELSFSLVLFISVLAQLSPSQISKIFLKEIVDVSSSLVSYTRVLVKELILLLQETLSDKAETKASEDAPKNHERNEAQSQINARLVSVSKMWMVCDEITKLIEAGNLKYLEKRTKIHLSLINDGLEEFSEWAENPKQFDDEDIFGLGDDLLEDGDETVPSAPEESDGEPQDKEYLTRYSKLWLDKFKLVRLLFFSINKSLPRLVAGECIDQIYEAQEQICRDIDLLIVDIMLSRIIDDVVKDHATRIDKGCLKIVKILKSENERSPKKVDWCISWESKFNELLDKMYKEC